MKALLGIGAAATVLALAACEGGGLRPPTNRGVCFHQVVRNGEPAFNVVAREVATLEDCAANLEAVRLRFNRMGARQEEMTGAYQGRFLFLRPSGIYTGTRADERGYLVLVRTGDGRLAQQGAVRR